jgi:hypothetical protein
MSSTALRYVAAIVAQHAACFPHCRTRSQDDARDTFKTLKNQHIGDASASLYYEWAVLEHSAGNVSKALGILAKGMRAEAQPIRYADVLAQHAGQRDTTSCC